MVRAGTGVCASKRGQNGYFAQTGAAWFLCSPTIRYRKSDMQIMLWHFDEDMTETVEKEEPKGKAKP